MENFGCVNGNGEDEFVFNKRPAGDSSDGNKSVGNSGKGDEFLYRLIGPNKPYYADIFQRVAEKKRLPFNLSAFFLGPIWFAYRKMYWIAWWYALVQSILLNIFLGIALVLKVKHKVEYIPITTAICISLVVSFVGAAVANRLYYFKLQNHLSLLKSIAAPDSDHHKALIGKYVRKNGGTSLLGTIFIGANWIMMIGGLWLLLGAFFVILYSIDALHVEILQITRFLNELLK